MPISDYDNDQRLPQQLIIKCSAFQNAQVFSKRSGYFKTLSFFSKRSAFLPTKFFNFSQVIKYSYIEKSMGISA
jgi:hypothetical protein